MWKFILPLTVSHKHQSKLLFRPFIIFAANKFILNTLFSLLIFLHFQFFILSVVQPSLASPVCSPSLWQLFLFKIMSNYTLRLLVILLDSLHSAAPWDHPSSTRSFSVACCVLAIPSGSSFSSPGTSNKLKSDEKQKSHSLTDNYFKM